MFAPVRVFAVLLPPQCTPRLAPLPRASRFEARGYCSGQNLMYCCNTVQTIDQAHDVLYGLGLLSDARASTARSSQVRIALRNNNNNKCVAG